MAKGNNVAERVKVNDVTITHIFKASRETVFRAWTDPEYLKRWFAPEGCSVSFRKVDIREGGSFHCCIKNPRFHDCWSLGVYQKIVVPEKIVYTVEISDERGNPAKPVDAGMDPEWPQKTTVTVLFEDYDGGTKITLHQTVDQSIAKRTGAYPSWIQMLEGLESELKNKVTSGN